MSKRSVCAVRDSAIQSFGQPIFVPHVGSAIRSFSDEVNRQAADNQLYMHPDDFELWVIAEFDDESGVFVVPDSGARCLARGKDVRVNKE